MPVTQVGIVYATNSKIHRHTVTPSRDDSELDAGHVGPGETMLKVPVASAAGGLPKWLALIQQATGVIPPYAVRAACVDPVSSLVVGYIMIDPEIDTHPQYTLVSVGTSQINWKWNGTQWLPRYVTVVNSVVTAVQWSAAQPVATAGQSVVQSSVGNIGDTFTITNAPSSGTVQI